MKNATDIEGLVHSILTRRQVLFSAGGLLLGGSALSLVGCGGSHSSSSSGGVTQVSGSVVIPAGSPISSLKLSVDVFGISNPVSSGAFKAHLAQGAPCLAVLNDPSGAGVMIAFLDPSSTTHTISTRTTAIALIFVALGAYMLPAAAMSHALQLIDGYPATSTLESVITKAVTADAYALQHQAPTISPGVVAAINSILGASSQSVKRSSVRAGPATMTPPTLLLLNPSGQQTGVDISQDASTSSLIVTNSFRRHCKVYIYETTTLAGSTTTDISPAKLISGPIELDSVEELNLWTAAKDFATFFHGTSPWSPISLPPIPIALDTGTDRTTYTVVVLGSSFMPSVASSEPAFFSDPHYVNEVADWRVAVEQLFVQTFIGDIFMPLLCMFGGFGAIVAGQAATAAIAANFGDYAANFRNIVTSVRAGETDIAPSLVACLEDAIANQVTRDQLSAELETLLDSARAQALRLFSSAKFAARLGNVLNMLEGLSPLFAVGALLQAGDIGATILDVAEAPFGDLWTALILKQTLKLSPLLPSASPGDRVTFVVSKPNDTTDVFEYDWTQTSAFATLSASDAVGNKITTKSLTVDLVTTPSDSAPITVTVTGYDVSSGQRVEIGKAGTVVTMLLPAQILPANPMLSAGDKQVFTVQVGGSPPAGLQYKWTLTGSSGSIGASPVTTTAPEITYDANTNGSDHLHVDVLDSTGALVAKADRQIQVGPILSTVTLTIAGTWPYSGTGPGEMPANGSYTYNDGLGVVVPLTESGSPPNSEAIFLEFDNYDNGDGTYTPGITFVIVLQTGELLVNERAYPLQPRASIQIDHFIPSIQSPFSDPGSLVPVPRTATASIIFTNVNQSTTGTSSANFTMNYLNTDGGSLFATGVGVWKPVPASQLRRKTLA